MAQVVIFNPPFSLAVLFVRQTWELFPGAWTVMLQRQSFLAPARARWLRDHVPDSYTLGRTRPKFRGGQSDACEYAWYVWPPDGRSRRVGQSQILYPAHQMQLL